MNVLVADSSKLVRAIIVEELEAMGLKTFEASNEKQIYEILKKTPIALMTLSVELPRKNGYEICKEVTSESFIHSPKNQSDRRFPIIFITSSDTMEHRKRGFESGAADFISKPFQHGEVQSIVKDLLFPETKLKGATAIVVDDSKQARMIVADFLHSLGVIVFEAENGREGLEQIQEYGERIDVIITDLEMPEMPGMELCFRVRKELGMKNVPILVLSGAEHISVLEIFQNGATDYLHKPFIKEELLGRLYVHLEARLLTKKLGQKVHEMEEMNHELKKIAMLDTMTGLPNRRYFFERFQEAVQRKERYNHTVAFYILDIDYFKKINDEFGHQVGDWIIEELGRVIKKTIRKVDILGRVGGEEFGLLVTHIDKKGAIALGAKIGKKIASHPFLKDQSMGPVHITISMGCFLSNPGDGLSEEQIYKLSDESLYKAKQKGRNCILCRQSRPQNIDPTRHRKRRPAPNAVFAPERGSVAKSSL